MIHVQIPNKQPLKPGPVCPKCGTQSQIWVNQITQKLTCHRAFCHTEIKVAIEGYDGTHRKEAK